MTQRELKARIKEDPNLTQGEKAKRLNELRQPYRALSDEELLQLVRDFTEENGREPMQADVLYDRELKERFGPWTRMLERAGRRHIARPDRPGQQHKHTMEETGDREPCHARGGYLPDPDPGYSEQA